MKRPDSLFKIALVLCLAIYVYLLTAAITGYVTQTLYCDGDICKKLCVSNSDCYGVDESCCQKGRLGVCEADCKEQFVMQIDYPEDLSSSAIIEQPRTQRMQKILLYSTILLVVIIIAVIYFMRGQKKPAPKAIAAPAKKGKKAVAAVQQKPKGKKKSSGVSANKKTAKKKK